MSDNQASVQLVLKPEVWYINRRMDFKPSHFITVKTPLTKNSAQWILNNLTGRFTFNGNNELNEDLDEVTYPSFEDPAEAILYELKWS